MLLKSTRLPELEDGRHGAGGLHANEKLMLTRLKVKLEQVAAVGLFLGRLRQAVAAAPCIDLPARPDMEETDVVEIWRHHFKPTRCRMLLRNRQAQPNGIRDETQAQIACEGFELALGICRACLFEG